MKVRFYVQQNCRKNKVSWEIGGLGRWLSAALRSKPAVGQKKSSIEQKYNGGIIPSDSGPEIPVARTAAERHANLPCPQIRRKAGLLHRAGLRAQ